MKNNPKTIQIFLPDGNARSIRIAEITSRTVQAIQIPRSKVAEAGKRDEIKRGGGEGERGGEGMEWNGGNAGPPFSPCLCTGPEGSAG